MGQFIFIDAKEFRIPSTTVKPPESGNSTVPAGDINSKTYVIQRALTAFKNCAQTNQKK